MNDDERQPMMPNRCADTRHDQRKQGGAVLLLLLIVIGLGGAILLMSALGKQSPQAANERRTLATLAQARDALIGFAAAHGRLPRPAISALDGRESPQPCRSEADCTGFIPWVTLGVERADSWGKLLRYSATPDFTGARVSRSDAIASKVIIGRDSRGGWFYVFGQDVCDHSSCAPAVVFSQGKNNFGTNVAGVRQMNVSTTNQDEKDNDGASQRFMSRQASADPTLSGGEFDDLLTWIPVATLFTRMAFAGTLQ